MVDCGRGFTFAFRKSSILNDMKRIGILFISFILSIPLLYAQRIKIDGIVIDGGTNKPAEFVNVVLQTPDSTFVAGVSTDANGAFRLEKIATGDYRLVVSALGYAELHTDLTGLSRSVDLGKLFLQEAAEQLEEVTVTASNMVSRADRKIVFPNQQQLAASTNGVNLLQTLMLPRIEVNPLSKEIVVSGGGAVQLCINGVKVEAQEIAALQPHDILRIEYLENPGLRYGNAEAVLNYITRHYETGGSLSLDLMNSPHVVFHNDAVSAKLNHKKSEFGLHYFVSPRDFYQFWRTNEEAFRFEDGTTLHRYEKGEPGHIREWNHGGHFTYNYQEPDKYLLNVKLGYWAYLQPHMDYKGQLYNVEYPERVTRMSDLNEKNRHRPSIDLYYQQNLKNRQFLALNLVGTYQHTESNRTYQERLDEEWLTDIYSGINGKKYSLIGEGIYEKGLAKGRLSTGLKHTQAFSDNRYDGNRSYHTEMKQSDTYLYAEYQGKWKKLNYTLGAGVTRSWLKQEGEEGYQTYTFRPRFSLQYSFSDHLYARLNGQLTNNPPALSELSAVEQLIDSMQIRKGNPNLNPYNQYQTDLYVEYRRKKCSLGFSTRYQNSPKAIMESTYIDNGLFVHTYENQDGFQYLNSELNLRVGMLWNILQCSLRGGVNRYWSDGKTYRHTYTNWYYRAEVMGQYKQWMAMFSIYNRRNRFWGESLSGGENMHTLMVQYKHKQLAIGAGMVNPFADNYKRLSENWNQYASSYKATYCNESSRAFFLTFSWNFRFGRQYQSGGKKIYNQDTDAGVLTVDS